MNDFKGYSDEAHQLFKVNHYSRVSMWSPEYECYFGFVPDLPDGCNLTESDTLDGCQEMIDDLILIYLDHCLEHGFDIPTVTTLNSNHRLVIDFEDMRAYWAEDSQ